MARRRTAPKAHSPSHLHPAAAAAAAGRDTAVMSTSDLGSIEHQSSDGTSTDARDSEGMRTEVTSIMETDPEPEPDDSDLDADEGADATEMVSDFEADDEDVAMETQSLYAQSHYPRTLAGHRAGASAANGRSEFDSQTM